jgi:integrase
MLETLTMPRPRPPGLHREVTRHGTVVWYLRIDRGKRIRIRAPYGTPEFQAEYQAAIAGHPLPGTPLSQGAAFAPRTFGWTIQRYRESAGAKGTWGDLSPATRMQREPFLRDAAMKAGRESLARITRAVIEKGMAARSPNVGRHFLYALRGLFQWAVAAQYCSADPTAGLKPILPKTDGYAVWPQEWCQKFTAHWLPGTPERLAFDLLYWTGLRASDAVRVGRQHIQNGMLIIRAKKNDKPVPIPIAPELQAALAAAPTTALTFITGANDRPLKATTFSARFIRAAAAAGVPGSAHGLRKTRATLLANAGATEAELCAIMGWRGTAMAQHYTRSRNETLLAERAANKLATSIPAPIKKVRDSAAIL